MSEMIKNKIKTANDPTVHNRRSFITIAKVIKSSEQNKNNFCSADLTFLKINGQFMKIKT